jgi:predicted metal-dependent HD superfamily phosphohydrolase
VFTCRHAPLTISRQIEQFLTSAYGESHRAYHTAKHIDEVLRWFDVVVDDVGWERAADVYLAILFHDAVYDPKAPSGDNEARSARLAQQMAGASERAAEMILMTARHGSLTRDDVHRDAAHFLDCDTAILGSAATEFDAYDAGIAFEYSHVPPELFRAGRRAFLEKMLASPRIFLSDLFHDRLDVAARANLARTITKYR